MGVDLQDLDGSRNSMARQPRGRILDHPLVGKVHIGVPQRRMDPEVSRRIFKDGVDGIVRNRIRSFKEMLEAETIIAVESYVGADPKKTPRILEHDVYAVVGQTVIDGQTTKLRSTRGCAEEQE